jgi:hypothetical protein
MYAIKLSVDIAATLQTKLSASTAASSSQIRGLAVAINAIATMSMPVPITEMRYQRLAVNVVSTTGAHNSFHVCGNR